MSISTRLPNEALSGTQRPYGVIYALLDPDTSEIRYVGHTRDLPSRIRDYRKRRRCGRAVAEWLKSMDGLPPVEVLAEATDEEALLSVEKEMIALHRSLGAPLLNVGMGGRTGRFDRARRRAARRSQQQKGCHIYIAQEELRELGIDNVWPLYFKAWTGGKRKNPSLVIQFFGEP